MKQNTGIRRYSGYLAAAAICLFLLICSMLAVSSHFVTAHESSKNYPMQELIVYWQDHPALSLLGTACVVLLLMGLRIIFVRGKRIHIHKMAYGLWILMAVLFLWAVRIQPRADFKVVTDAATAFSRGDFSPLTDTAYFSDFSFNLGICLLMEGVLRLFPFADLALLMQIFNVFLSVAAVYAMARITVLLTQTEQDGDSVNAVYLLFLPMLLYCVYVYGTIPMIALSAWAILNFILYLREGKARHGVTFALCIGVAALLKTNALVVLIALAIIALLHVLDTKKAGVLIYMALGAALSLGLPKLTVWIYETRSGVSLNEGMSMIVYLMVGLQEGEIAPGWFNDYGVPFSPSLMPPETARPILLADLQARIAAFASDPGMLWQFMKEKCLSQWLEPTYSTLWNGSLSEIAGKFNGVVYAVYREGSEVRLALEHVMDAYQQALYVLSSIGAVCTLRRYKDAVQALLPTMILGGFLYHQLFEGKSQYTYMYMFFMIPLAAQGLSALSGWIGRRRCAK